MLAGWTELSYPAAPVSSVAGRAGSVTLASADLTDRTSTGAALFTASSAAAARTAIGAGGLPGGSDNQIQRRIDGTTLGGAPLWVDDANTLAQRNGVSAQTFRVFRAFIDALNGEWMEANSAEFSGAKYVRLAALANGSGAASIGLALSPRGTGGITAQVPDGTTLGGSLRGARSVDFQHDRIASTQVASGINAVIVGGRDNTASNSGACVAGGFANTASGQFAVVPGGVGNTASGSASWVPGGSRATTRGIFGSFAWAANRRSVDGDSQTFGAPLASSTTSSSPAILTTNRSAPSITNVVVLPDNSCYVFNVIIAARSDAGLTARWSYDVTVKRGVGAGSTQLVSATLISSYVEPGLVGVATEVVADTVFGSAQVRVTGLAVTTIDWYAQMLGGQLVR